MRFAIVRPGRPPSSQSSGARKFSARLHAEAAERYSDGVVQEGDLYTRIIWFHAGGLGGQDVDNIIKPIHDALIGVVYKDDVLIAQCLAARVDLSAGYELKDEGLPAEEYDTLVGMLAEAPQATEDRRRHVLYVEVGVLAAQRVAFGPPDGVGP